MFRTLTTSRPARLIAAAGVLGLLATGCTSNTPETTAVRLERPGRGRQRQRRPGREGHHRLLRPGGRPRLARRRQQLREGGGREVLGHRLQDGGGHQRRQPADQPDRDLHQRQGRRHRAAADRRGRAHRGGDQGDAGRHHGRQRRPRVLLAVRRPHHRARRQLRHGGQRRHLRLQAHRGQEAHQPGHRRDRRHRLAAADPGPQQGLRRRPEGVRPDRRQPGRRRVHRRVR